MGKIRSNLPGAVAFAVIVAGSVTTPSQAQTAAGESPPSARLEEVVVTATKRTEDVQNVGLSMTVLGAEQLESKGVSQFWDYGNAIPNLSFATGASDGSLASRGIAIRGIAGSNTTGFYIDDTPVLETLDPHIVDVERIEVLRGPQGTLYGAQSMGGTVRIITTQPDLRRFNGQVHAELSDTDHGSWNELVEGAINIPLVTDTLAVRASAFYNFDSGFFYKEIGPEPGPPAYTLHDIGSMEYYGGQLALRWEPLAGLSIIPRIMYQKTDQHGVPYAPFDPNNLVQRQVFNIDEGGQDRWYLASLTLNYTAPFGTFVSSTAYFDRHTFETEDDTDVTQLDLGLAEPTPSPITRELDLQRFAQEVRFVSSFSGPFQMVAGGFYSNSTRPRDYEWTAPGLATLVPPPPPPWTTDPLLLTFIDSRTAKDYAAFADVSYDITKSLRATVGGRWFKDTATFSQFTNGQFFGGVPSTYNAPETSESGVTPKYLLEYKATPDLLLYASAAKGFREGGNNIALPPGPPPAGCDQDLANIGLTAADVTTFKSDSLWNYEAGFKSSFADHRYTLNATGFTIDWSQIQQQVSLPLCGYGFTGNSGRARSKGFELDFNGRPLPELTVGFGFGYTDARITEKGTGTPQLPGSRVYNVPEITTATNIEYQAPITVTWMGFARADYAYVGDSYSANNSQFNPLHRAGYSIVDFRFGMRKDRLELIAFVKNLTNEHANLADAIMIGAQVPGQPNFTVNQPRTIGVGARMLFQ